MNSKEQNLGSIYISNVSGPEGVKGGRWQKAELFIIYLYLLLINGSVFHGIGESLALCVWYSEKQGKGAPLLIHVSPR